MTAQIARPAYLCSKKLVIYLILLLPFSYFAFYTATTILQSAPLPFSFFHQYDETLVDIDIGTRGVPIKSDLKLITFDPGDELRITDKMEVYPYVVGNIDGITTFYINEAIGGCSSLKMRNNFYNSTLQSIFELKHCGTKANLRPESQLTVWKCMHGPIRPVSVNSTKLSTFLKNRRIRKINILKIDAQGSDLEIVIDLLLGYPAVNIKTLIMECQRYSEAVPLYHASNDCDEAVKFVKSIFPTAAIKWNRNSCFVNEYNLFFTNLIPKT